MQRLFDEDQVPEKFLERLGRFPKGAEGVEAPVLFIAIEREGKLGRQATGQLAQTGEIGVFIAGEFDFEMCEAVFPDAIRQRLRQAVVELSGASQRIAKTDGVPHDDLSERCAAPLNTQRTVIQRHRERLAGGATESINHRALDKANAETPKQWRVFRAGRPLLLRRVELLPEREYRRRGR